MLPQNIRGKAQRQIRFNHLAHVRRGRLGQKAKIHLDSAELPDGAAVRPQNAEQLEQLADDVLKEFDRVFVYFREEGDVLKERVVFYREDANTVTVVDEPSGKLMTTYPLRPDVLEDYENDYIEIVP